MVFQGFNQLIPMSIFATEYEHWNRGHNSEFEFRGGVVHACFTAAWSDWDVEMSAAHRMMENPAHTISDEAQRRVESARVREFAFKLKTFVGKHHVETADLEMLARALLDEIERAGNRVEREAVVGRLMAFGRTRSKAEHLASLVLV